MVLLVIGVVDCCLLLGVVFYLGGWGLVGDIWFWLFVSCLAIVVRAFCCVVLFGWFGWCLCLWALVVSVWLLVGLWLLVG